MSEILLPSPSNEAAAASVPSTGRRCVSLRSQGRRPIDDLPLLSGIARHEWRVLGRSPVWIVGLCGALYMTVSETSSNVGWPTVNQSLYGFQLATTMLLGLTTFLLATGSMLRDMEGSRDELLLCRPVSMPLYVSGKFLGVFLFSLAIVAFLLCFSVLRPWFHGKGHVYDVRPFLVVLGVALVPMVAYTCSLALVLAVSFRRLVVALPVYLLYFFGAALLHPHDASKVYPFDFSMRLYPRHLVTEVPFRLTDASFAGLLDPVAPALLWKAAAYLAVSGVFLGATMWILVRRRRHGRCFPRPGFPGGLKSGSRAALLPAGSDSACRSTETVA